MNPKKIWKEHRVAEGKTLFWQIGPLQLWLQRSGAEWLVAERRLAQQCGGGKLNATAAPPEGMNSRSWAFGHPCEFIHLRPCLPDRPLVVKTLIPTIVSPPKEIVFFLSLPLCVELSVGKGAQRWVLARIPSRILSHTWIGNPFEGEGGYILKTPAVPELKAVKLAPNRVVCSFRITNCMDDPMPIEKLCIRPEFLGIYITDRSLWTNEMKVTFQGEHQEVAIRYLSGAPASVSKAVLLRPADKKGKRSFFQCAFGAYAAYFSDA